MGNSTKTIKPKWLHLNGQTLKNFGLNFSFLMFSFTLILNVKAQFLTKTFGNTCGGGPDYCTSGCAVGNNFVSVGFIDDRSLIISTDNYVNPIPPCISVNCNPVCSIVGSSSFAQTNGLYQYFNASNLAGTFTKILDIAELDGNAGLFVVTGSCYYPTFDNDVFISVMDVYGRVYCSYKIGDINYDEIGTAVAVSQNAGSTGYKDIYITGQTKQFGIGFTETDLIAMKFEFSILGSVPSLNLIWNKTYDILSKSTVTYLPHTASESGGDLINLGSNLYIVGSIYESFVSGLALKIDEATGNYSTTNNFNYIFQATGVVAPNNLNVTLNSIKYDNNNSVYISGTGANYRSSTFDFDFYLNNVNISTGIINFENLYDMGYYENDFSNNMIFTQNNSTFIDRCYLLGTSEISNSVNQSCLLITDNNGDLLTTSSSGFEYGDINKYDFGAALSEDPNGNFIRLHSYSNSYTSNFDFDIKNIQYDGLASCDSKDNLVEKTTAMSETKLCDMDLNFTIISPIYTSTPLCYSVWQNNDNVVCSSSSLKSGLKNNKINEKIKLYPTILDNNNNNIVTIELKTLSNSTNVELELYNNLGSLIQKNTVNFTEKLTYELPSNISIGVYFIKVIYNNQIQTFKIIK